jgi:hypothetical protein
VGQGLLERGGGRAVGHDTHDPQQRPGSDHRRVGLHRRNRGQVLGGRAQRGCLVDSWSGEGGAGEDDDHDKERGELDPPPLSARRVEEDVRAAVRPAVPCGGSSGTRTPVPLSRDGPLGVAAPWTARWKESMEIGYDKFPPELRSQFLGCSSHGHPGCVRYDAPMTTLVEHRRESTAAKHRCGYLYCQIVMTQRQAKL